MVILLLLLAQAGGDWVEISQNHYVPQSIYKVASFEHTTMANRIYKNNSLIDKQWHRGAVDKLSNIGNIRRVQHPSVKTNFLKTRNEGNRFTSHFNDHSDIIEAEYNLVTIKPNVHINKYDADDDVFEHRKVTDINNPTADVDQVKYLSSKPIDRRKQYDQKHNIDMSSVSNDNQKTQLQFGEHPMTKVDKLDFNEKPNIHRVSVADEVNVSTSKNSKNRLSNYSVIQQPKLIPSDFVKENVKHKVTNANNINDKINFKPQDIDTHSLEEYFDSSNHFKNPINSIDKHSEEMNKKSNPEKSIQYNKEMLQSMNDKDIKTNAGDYRRKEISNSTKATSVNGMWKLIKVVADTIYRNTHRSFRSKIQYLESLKTTILTTIEDQVESAWPDDVEAPKRKKRAAQRRGHVDFPSSESTLMTISFLTFAVFLIKLVLQVIHTYKNKTMMVAPAVVTAVGRAADALRTRANDT